MHTKISALSVVILLTSAVFSLPSGDGNEIRQQASSEELQDIERVSAKNPEQIHLAYTGETSDHFLLTEPSPLAAFQWKPVFRA